MRSLRFVTGNAGKAAEAASALAGVATVERVDVPVIEVQADELGVVAWHKASALLGRVREPYFVDDGGLFVDALKGFPGVYSAPTLKSIGAAGILRLMEGVADRRARFECVVGYVDGGEVKLFKGRCDGHIADAPRSTGHGFGFDPIFVPAGDKRTFAEIPTEEKNAMSHRGKALAELRKVLA